MSMSVEMCRKFSNILHEDLLVALGCTEPICIAYCSSKMREVLGQLPESILVECSGNIIKNVKGAVVPNSGGLKGVDAAAVLGAVGGNPAKELEVLTDITEAHIAKTKEFLTQNYCQVKLLETGENLHVRITGTAGAHKAIVELMHTHTRIVKIVRDDEVLFDISLQEAEEKNQMDPLFKDLTIRNILTFSEEVDLDDYGLRMLLERQIELNTGIADEGLSNPYGAGIGQLLIKDYGNNVKSRARAYAAAGSDARMSGCDMPVVINSGSGNQGITVSLPVIQFAKELNKTRDELLRALIISNLVAIHIKSSYGRLSAFCGAVSAAAGCGAAITWMHGCDYLQISGTIINTIANISGMVCDGAKPSCASKIASAVDAAIMGHCMSMEEKQFMAGDGLVKQDIEATIQSIGRMASEGMLETDRKIIELMLESINK